jgi:hypothetical protein
MAMPETEEVDLLLTKEKKLRNEEENLLTELRRVRDERKRLLDAILEVRAGERLKETMEMENAETS